jgi:hypothetical protein
MEGLRAAIDEERREVPPQRLIAWQSLAAPYVGRQFFSQYPHRLCI